MLQVREQMSWSCIFQPKPVLIWVQILSMLMVLRETLTILTCERNYRPMAFPKEIQWIKEYIDGQEMYQYRTLPALVK